MDINKAALEIGRLIKEGSESVYIEVYKAQIDLLGENFLVELLHHTANKITYLREPEGRDYWQPVGETLLKKTGDCEDFTILIGAVLFKAGYPVLVKFTASKDVFDHVYPLSWDKKSKIWVALDGTLPTIGLDLEGSYKKSEIYALNGGVIGETKIPFTYWIISFIAIAVVILIVVRG